LNATRLKIELLCRGAHIKDQLDRGRKSGAGPTGGSYFNLPNGTCVEIPLQGRFIEDSPFTIVNKDGNWRMLRNSKTLIQLRAIPKPRFYEKTTSDGIPMRKIAAVHGKDCLASTIYSKCIHWRSDKQCRFCAIELGRSNRLMKKKPAQLAEAAEEAFQEGAVRHVTLTTGTPPTSDRGALMLAEATKAIKERVDMPIHVQLQPPEDPKFFKTLQRAEVDTVGLHVESFDQNTLNTISPAKSNIQEYFLAWRSAVELFGEGQVSTFVIAGLGETDQSILTGSEKAAHMGVIPYLLPLRPIAGTYFGEAKPPAPDRMMRLYRGVSETLHRTGLDPRKNKAGCVRCGACSAIQEARLHPTM